MRWFIKNISWRILRKQSIGLRQTNCPIESSNQNSSSNFFDISCILHNFCGTCIHLFQIPWMTSLRKTRQKSRPLKTTHSKNRLIRKHTLIRKFHIGQPLYLSNVEEHRTAHKYHKKRICDGNTHSWKCVISLDQSVLYIGHKSADLF